MTGAQIKVDDKAVLAALRKLIEVTGNPEPALKNIGEYMQQETIGNIEAQRSSDGSAFKPLNELYAKTKKGPGILRGESGDLSRIVYQLGDGEVVIGSNSEHAAIHQFGGVIKPKSASALVFEMGGQLFKVKSVTIPARPYLGVSSENAEEILAIFQDYIEAASGLSNGP